MGHFLQFLPNRPVQGRMTMPMDVGPDGGVAIQVASADTIFQPRSLSGNQHQRLVIGQYPVTHLRERMPNVRLIKSDEGFGVKVHSEEIPEERWSIGVLE